MSNFCTNSNLLPRLLSAMPFGGADYEYERLGTVSLLAGLDLHSGQVI
jgi:hypothetical protein